jgi:hypothetical protein
MGAGEHVDAIDLVERKTLDRAAEVAMADARRACGAEALRGKGDPARGGG